MVLLASARAGEFRLPFGLAWGDGPDPVIAWAGRHGLDVELFFPADDRSLRILRVRGKEGNLPEGKGSALELRYLGGRLYEATVHFRDPDASADLMGARYELERRRIGKEWGKTMAAGRTHSVEKGWVVKSVSHRCEIVKGQVVLLVFTEVEDQAGRSRDAGYSAVYRNEHYRRELADGLSGAIGAKAGEAGKLPEGVSPR